jgi:hypothetical protein
MAKEIIRKSGKDLKAEFEDLIVKKTALENKITNRLIELCRTNPEAIVNEFQGEDGKILIKAKSYTNNYIKNYFTHEERIDLIIAIEKWLADQHPHKQTTIEFPEE